MPPPKPRNIWCWKPAYIDKETGNQRWMLGWVDDATQEEIHDAVVEMNRALN